MKFKITGSQTHYRGRAFSVEKVDFTLPDGRQASYDLVRHNDSVSIVPVDEHGYILFVSQYRLGAENLLLELPAGVDEDGESPEDSAAREIREETGMAAGKMVRLGEFYLAPGYSSELMYVFLATNLTPAPLQADPDEFLQVKAIPIEEAYAMARRGEIRDSKSLAALLLAEPYLRPEA
ncbi:MAG: NUDIX hydrolase [Chloroflexi bacterium]|nr:NUDIX hydrolase [Chloroflexota bacterium]